jgi:hypothetical protein
VAANDGEHPVRETFPGIPVPDTTGAAGSAGARTPAPSKPWAPGTESGIPGVGVPMSLYLQLDAQGARAVTLPGQLNEMLSGLGPEDIADTGAGRGRAGHWDRYDWQPPDGAA